ncbi:hypothetical protein L596_013240 [Steinernema carpocapsae]|uniref:Uncharacterized protein n=1 Tax=Steinernema carpocapsae TaxID=34508 RepID=A0A4V6A524_STECR|nr:hypothetical protein L596_013240 [Steinernema carpocapsae]
MRDTDMGSMWPKLTLISGIGSNVVVAPWIREFLVGPQNTYQKSKIGARMINTRRGRAGTVLRRVRD